MPFRCDSTVLIAAFRQLNVPLRPQAFLRTMVFDAHADRSPRLDPTTGMPDLNRSFGPFIARFIEPHHSFTNQLRIDFDVNNLLVVAGFTQELGALLLLLVHLLLLYCFRPCRLPSQLHPGAPLQA